MASRRVYRGIEDSALRGERIDIIHVHSALALNLRYQYREIRDAREFDMEYGLALASLYGNSNADLKAGSETVNKRFTLAKSRIPYYNIGVESDTIQRERAVKRLRLLKKHVAMLTNNGKETEGDKEEQALKDV